MISLSMENILPQEEAPEAPEDTLLETAEPSGQLQMRAQRLGDNLVRMGVLKPKQVNRILAKARKKDISFGEAAKSLGLASDRDIRNALSIQHGYNHGDARNIKVPRPLVTLHSPQSDAAEQFRQIRTRLLTRDDEMAMRLLAVSSAGVETGSSFVSANLAVSISQLGRKVLLIDGNLRHSHMNQMFHIRPGVGLTDVVRGECDLKDAFAPSTVRNLTYLRQGRRTHNPQELLSSHEFAAMVMEQIDRFDTVILNTGNGLATADPQLVWALAKSVLLVARSDKTRVQEVKKISSLIEDCRAQLVGTVMTR